MYVQASDAYAERNLDKAYTLALQACKNKPDFFQAQLLQAKVLYFQDKNSEAEKCLKKLLKKHPEFTEARLYLVRTLIQMESYGQAKSLLDTELSFNQTDWRFFYLYALLSEKQESLDMRLAMQKRAEQSLEDSSKVYTDLAFIWLKLEMRDKALDYLEKAQCISSRPEAIQQAIDHIKSGDDIL